MRQLWSTHPNDLPTLDTDGLRERFLITDLFSPGNLTWAYTHDDRLLVGGLTVHNDSVHLSAPEEIAADFFLQRRELGIIGLDGTIDVRADGTVWSLKHHDVLYLPMGTHDVEFSGSGSAYLVSAPAHRAGRAALASRDEVEAVHLGDPAQSNKRTIRKYIHADGIESNQLVLGITTLEDGSVWNTMPPHLHSRRTEIYLYDGLGEGVVQHTMGAPAKTRQLTLRDREAIVSPPWSIHCGAGTGSYSFVWAMAGENIDYTDVSPVETESLR